MNLRDPLMRMASIFSRAGYFCSFTTSHFEISRPPFEDNTSGIRRASAPASRSALNTRPYPPYFRVSHSRIAIRRGVFILNSVKDYCLSGDSFKQFRYGCDIGKNTSLLRLDFAASFSEWEATRLLLSARLSLFPSPGRSKYTVRPIQQQLSIRPGRWCS
jgi:hypothetical protein